MDIESNVPQHDRAKLSDKKIKRVLAMRIGGIDKAVAGLPFGKDRLAMMHFQLNKDMMTSAGKFRDPDIPRFLDRMEERIEDKNGLKGASQYETVTELTNSLSDLVRTHPFDTENDWIAKRFLSDLTAEAGHAIDWKATKPGEWKQVKQDLKDGKKQAATSMFHRIFQERGITVEHGQSIMGSTKHALSSDKASTIAQNLKEKKSLKKEKGREGLHP